MELLKAKISYTSLFGIQQVGNLKLRKDLSRVSCFLQYLRMLLRALYSVQFIYVLN